MRFAREVDDVVQEHQLLDVADGVDAVGAGAAGVGHGPGVVDIALDVVVGAHVGIDRLVDFAGLGGRLQDLAHDAQLARIDAASQHVVAQVGDRVDAADLDIRVGFRAHADAHVEPGVAVDQVVAVLAGDLVAAGAADQDVAA
ncbi:MAG: hypothetical protein C0489_11255, partial [Candidatus Accumulibacter sp.]|nr:hypothetical protein [Accumulibacter sp.]